MTTDQRAAINKANAQHSTGPKTEESKAKVSQNAVSHGLTCLKPPFENPHFLSLLNAFLEEYKPQTPTAHTLVLEIAHIAFKLEQIPQLEYEVELQSGLTLAEHFMQDKPTPLVKLWNLQLRLGGRFNSLDRKLRTLKSQSQNEPSPNAPANPPLQIKPTPSNAHGFQSVGISPSQKPILQNKPPSTPSPLQNEADKTKAMVRQLLSFATREVKLPI